MCGMGDNERKADGSVGCSSLFCNCITVYKKDDVSKLQQGPTINVGRGRDREQDTETSYMVSVMGQCHFVLFFFFFFLLGNASQTISGRLLSLVTQVMT